MAATPPTREPTSLRAGDTVQWTRAVTDYSAADGWILTYHIVGTGGTLTKAATTGTDGSGYAVTLTAAETAGLAAGDYAITGRVALDGAVFTVYDARLTVLPNMATADASTETRSFWRKYRDDIKQALAVYGTDITQAYTIMGERAVTLKTIDDFHKGLAMAEAMVAAEDAAAGTGGGSKNVLMRFRNAR